jgi:hypothetical protein
MAINMTQMILSFALDFHLMYLIDPASLLGVAVDASQAEVLFDFFYLSTLNFSFFGYSEILPQTIPAKIVQSSIQDCLVAASGGNELDISGSGNRVDNLHQRVSISVSSDCGILGAQKGEFESKMQASVAQNLKDQSVAMTQWMDNSRRKSSEVLNQSVSTEMDQKMVQNCASKLNGKNIVTISGDNNLVTNTSQDAVLSLISSCMEQNGQAAKAAAAMTNTVNQHQAAVSENPLAFIGDAIDAAIESVGGMVALAFILAGPVARWVALAIGGRVCSPKCIADLGLTSHKIKPPRPASPRPGL